MATKTIKADGTGDYTTLSGWAAYVNVLALAAPEIAEVYNVGEISQTTAITIGGWTGGSSSNTVTLRTAAGASFRDNANVQTNALRYNASNGAAIKWTATYINPLTVTGTFFSCDGLQFAGTGANTESGIRNQGADNTIRNTIMQFKPRTNANAGAALVNSATRMTIQNAVLYVANAIGVGFNDGGNPSAGVYTDMTIMGLSSTATGFRTAYTGGIVKNCSVFGFTTDYSGTANASSSNNATDKGSFGGTNYGTTGQVSVTSAEWQSVTSGSEDFRLASGSTKLKDNGATVTPANDIAGTTRPQGSAYDIGCWELVVAAAASDIIPLYQRSGFGGTSYGLRA